MNIEHLQLHHSDAVVQHIKAHSTTVTFIPFNYAERMTSERGSCTCWDVVLRQKSAGDWTPTPRSQRLISPSSSFHSLVNDISHLSSGPSRVSGTAGVVPGAAVLGNINQKYSWLRQRETSSRPLLYFFLRSHSYKLLAEQEGEFECGAHSPWWSYPYMNSTSKKV